MVEVAGAISARLSDFSPQRLISDRRDARVYQARHPRSNELIALKVWRQAAHLLTAQQRVGFTEQFAWLTAASRDTGRIVRCRDAGLDGFPWVAMDLCDGSLAEIGDDHDGVGVELARDVADALLTVVRRLLQDGKVHGRLSRSNLLVTRGRVVLGDFGMLSDPRSGRTRKPDNEDDLATSAAVVLNLLPDRIPPPVRQVLADVALRPPGAPVDEDITAVRTALGLAPERVRPPELTPDPPMSNPSTSVPAPSAPMPKPQGQVDLDRQTTRIPESSASVADQVRVPPENRPGLLITLQGREYRLVPGTEAMIGRDPTAQIRVLDPLVSRRHARIHYAEDGWWITDIGSSNGVWRDGVRISNTTVGSVPVRVRVGSPRGPELVLSRQLALAAPSSVMVPGPKSISSVEPVPSAEGTTILGPLPELRSSLPVAARPAPGHHDLPPGSLVIGRAPDCEVVLDDLMVSRRHAELCRSDDQVTLLDLRSANGTFVNGDRVRRHDLTSGDLIGLGGFTLRFEGTRLVEVDDADGVEFGAHGLSVLVDGDRFLSDVSFRLPPCSLMAIVGPSGTGKTTLLNALAGLRPATAGQVLYGGRDLYRNYGELRQRIGYVPQQNILHPGLTLQRVLQDGARLRLPSGISAEERADRIHEVVEQLGLTRRLHTRIDRLSEGERTRAETAVELITGPPVLLMDKPASGPDVDLDRDMMRQLRGLADDGHTVIVATPHLEHLSVCDVVMVLANGGRVAYLGPPDGVFENFQVRDWADVFTAVKESPPGRLASYFRRRPDRDPRSYPSKPLDATAGTALTGALPALPSRPSCRGQLRALIQRQASVIVSDRTLVALLVLLPVGIALIARGIPSGLGLTNSPEDKDTIQTLLVLVVGAALMGAAGAIRELVTERSIYLRERAVGVSWVVYLWSKIVVLSVIGVLQAAVMTVVALFGREPSDATVVTSWWMLEIGFVVAAVTVVSVVMGLAISALVREEGQGMPLLVLFTMGQLVGSGGVVPVAGSAGLEQFAWFMPARWAFAAIAATVDPQYTYPELPSDGFWNYDLSSWQGDMIMVFLLGLLSLAVVVVLLRRLDPRHPWDSSLRSRLGLRKRGDADTGPQRPGEDMVSDDVIAESSS